MAYEVHHINKWAYANLDMVEETLEKEHKAVILIAGASSSGKSYCAAILKELLQQNGHKTCIISLDQYNVGLSNIIPNKVNLNFFDNSLPNMKEICSRIKKIIYDVPFDSKYKPEVLERIRDNITDLLNQEDVDKFIDALAVEWAKLNFDEPTVYDMKEAAADVKLLLKNRRISKKKYSKVVSERVPSNSYISGKDYEVIIVEGIYSLDSTLLDELEDVNTIKDFIDGNPKSLFLRRIIRDAKITSASSVFTISAYFKYIVKSYLSTINPCRQYADIILNNDMTFDEMRAGTLYTNRFLLHTQSKKALEEIKKQSTIVEQVYQKDIYLSVEGEEKSKNLLRLRCISQDGINYTPSSLVHKGLPKIRRDNKVIRPINVFLKEGEFNKVWSSLDECIHDFAYAGFLIGPVEFKVKTRVDFENTRLNLREIKDHGYSIEFVSTPKPEIVKKIKKIIRKAEEE